MKTLYHFTSAHALDRIRKEGITRGALAWHLDRSNRPCLIRHPNERQLNSDQLAVIRKSENEGRIPRRPGYQWLTCNPSWEQSWAFHSHLEFPKNAYRITVVIPPRVVERRLSSWAELCRRYNPDSAAVFNTPAFDWENWFVHYGPIPPMAFLEIERNPGERIVPGLADPT